MRQPLFGLLNVRAFFKSTFRIAAYSIALTVTVAAAQAQTQTGSILPGSSQPVAQVGVAKPIMGWVRFCEQYPEECAVDPSEPATIQLGAKEWQTIVRINQQVNAAIKPKTDMDHWGVEDVWDFAEDGYGDCEDYQLVKRKRLVEAGFPRRALRMTVVIDEEGAGHAVMMVRTNRGDFILDNKRNAVLPWHRTGYTYIKREGDQGMAWASLGGQVSPTMTANQ
ncbi:transglutaminase-like cysteine peptidase [Microvirga lotononidis]|uniref:Putative periplasmic protein n=1 Tax=Microvirga lotononidis TaxID=864069 RepID=I4YYT6_9HYPH|nr:transglutaminase-like cysteine peptidase [Microvirga lotononidis]EIM29128.1 putative periplasmic protein [Microvirga lotononidis]WQO28972.1 transglutaminase-like cysteine peptidase [Microvirga lotononidis]